MEKTESGLQNGELEKEMVTKKKERKRGKHKYDEKYKKTQIIRCCSARIQSISWTTLHQLTVTTQEEHCCNNRLSRFENNTVH